VRRKKGAYSIAILATFTQVHHHNAGAFLRHGPFVHGSPPAPRSEPRGCEQHQSECCGSTWPGLVLPFATPPFGVHQPAHGPGPHAPTAAPAAVGAARAAVFQPIAGRAEGVSVDTVGTDGARSPAPSVGATALRSRVMGRSGYHLAGPVAAAHAAVADGARAFQRATMYGADFQHGRARRGAVDERKRRRDASAL